MNLMLPVFKIPDEINWLFTSYFLNSKKSFSKISDEIYQSPFLKMVVNRVFKEYYKNENLEMMFNAIGWNGFRDRLASIYIYKLEHGQFPDNPQLQYVEEIKKFEQEFEGRAPEGDSRLFMLGFYLKLAQIHLKNEHQYTNENFLVIKPVVTKALSKGMQKSIRLDWLILTLMLLADCLTEEELFNVIDQHHGNFYKILGILNDEKKEYLIENLLAYGASINDNEMFIYDKV